MSHPRTEDIILFVLQNSLHPTQPHSVIANYDKDHFVDEARLQPLICTCLFWIPLTQTRELETNDNEIALTLRRYTKI